MFESSQVLKGDRSGLFKACHGFFDGFGGELWFPVFVLDIEFGVTRAILSVGEHIAYL